MVTQLVLVVQNELWPQSMAFHSTRATRQSVYFMLSYLALSALDFGLGK